MILLVIAGVIILVFILLAVLDHLNITHIFMKRPGSAVGNAMRAMQDALEPEASKAHEYIIEQKEEKDKAHDKVKNTK